RKGSSQPQQGPPTVSASQGARMVKELIDRGQKLAQSPVTRDDYEQWKIEVEQTLSDALGQNNSSIWPVVEATAKQASVISLGWDHYEEPTEADKAQERAANVATQLKMLLGHAKSLEARAAAIEKPPSEVQTAEMPMQRLMRILDRFHDVARQLRRRHD